MDDVESEEYKRRLNELIEHSREHFGTAGVSESGIDRSQFRANLELTPTERVEKMVSILEQLLPLRGAMRRQAKT